MSLRITGGEARGRSINSPSGLDVRPTSSKIRQALFNIIAGKVVGAKFLDLCGGTGLMGIEALSRGAASLTTIEIERKLAANIKDSIDKLGYEAEVIVGDLQKRLPGLQLRGEKFDIIFADPPYRSRLAKSVIELVDRHDLLDEHGLLIIEHGRDSEIDLEKTTLRLSDQREYGQTCISFFKRDEKAKP